MKSILARFALFCTLLAISGSANAAISAYICSVTLDPAPLYANSGHIEFTLGGDPECTLSTSTYDYIICGEGELYGRCAGLTFPEPFLLAMYESLQKAMVDRALVDVYYEYVWQFYYYSTTFVAVENVKIRTPHY